MSSPFPQRDRIVLEGMRFYGFHGVNPEERVLGQEYLVDLTVEMDLSRAGRPSREGGAGLLGDARPARALVPATT